MTNEDRQRHIANLHMILSVGKWPFTAEEIGEGDRATLTAAISALEREGQMEVWLAEYCECHHETGYVVLSVHATEQGAQAKIAAHEAECRAEHTRVWANSKTPNEPFPDWTHWRVRKMEVSNG